MIDKMENNMPPPKTKEEAEMRKMYTAMLRKA